VALRSVTRCKGESAKASVSSLVLVNRGGTPPLVTGARAFSNQLMRWKGWPRQAWVLWSSRSSWEGLEALEALRRSGSVAGKL